jgi:undecaprenyl-diphosphatase
VRGRRIPIAMNVMTLFEQTDRALTLSANQFAGRSLVLDQFVNHIVDLPLLNGGVFLAAYWWLWFEADETTVCAQRRNVVASLLGAIVIAGVSHLLKGFLQLHYLPLHYPDLGMRLPFVVALTPINDVSSFPSTHAALFFSLSVLLWMRSRWLGAAAVVWTLLVICLPLLYLGYHWASDVIAGAVFGVALMLLLRRLIGAAGLPDRVVRFSATNPPAFYAVAWLFALQFALLFGDVRAFFLDAASLARALLS